RDLGVGRRVAARRFRVGRRAAFARQTDRSIRDRVRRNADQPGAERRAAPFEIRQRVQRLVEDLGGQLLRVGTVAYASDDESVDALEMAIVEIAETRRLV